VGFREEQPSLTDRSFQFRLINNRHRGIELKIEGPDMTDEESSGRRKVARRSTLVRRDPEQRGQKHHRGTVRMLDAICRIHQLLKKGHAVSTQRLQQELEAKNRRTVLRYISILNDVLHADVRFDPDAGGYRYYGNMMIALPEPMLTEGDLFALYVASPVLAQYRGTPLGEQFESSFAKIVALLPEAVKKRMLAVPRRVETKTRVPLYGDARYFAQVLSALHHGRQLELSYRSADRGLPSERTVDPYVLCVVNSKWYLLAYDYRRARVLSFAVERIWGAKETHREFDRPEGFSAADHLKDAFGIYLPPEDSGEKATEIVIRFDALAARYVRETKHHWTQKIRDLPGKEIEVTFTVRGTIEVENFVLGWGEHAEVLAPASLRKRVRERLARAFARYGIEE
jgi:predicted DNA-binding transcriptional regulator YafY